MNNLPKILDRVRKLLQLAEHTTSEAEAANAAAQAAKLMAEYELSEALVRLEEPGQKAEAIVEEPLDPERDLAHSKRVAWKETIAVAVAHSLGIHPFWTHQHINGRRRSSVQGFGRESAVQTWRYTCQYLWRTADELAESEWEKQGRDHGARGWKNAFRVGCASRLAVRLEEKKSEAEKLREEAKKAAMDASEARESLAMTLVEKDHEEVNSAYKVRSKKFGTISGIGSVSSYSGYEAGRDAGDRVSLGGGGRAGLASGRGMLTE
jgi:hypothetical protein